MLFNYKDFRQMHNLFQAQLGELMDSNQSQISRAELRKYSPISLKQYKLLCEKFGKEEVDEYITEEDAPAIASHNHNTGAGNQSINVNDNDARALDIIHKQNEALTVALKKQTEQNDRLLSILEKLAEKE